MVIFGKKAKELLAKVERLEKQVANLKNSNASLSTSIKELRQDVKRLKGLDQSIEKQAPGQKSQDQILNEWLNGPEEDEGGK